MLMIRKLLLKLRRVVKESVRRKLDLDKLRDPLTQKASCSRLQNRFEVLAEMDVQEEKTWVEDI